MAPSFHNLKFFPLFLSFSVGSKVSEVTYSLTTMDEIFRVLSFFGGTTFILFGSLYILLIPYEAFQLELQMLKSFYSVSRHESGSQINTTEKDVRLSMAEMLSNRKQYEYSFCIYQLTLFACCRRPRCRELK